MLGSALTDPLQELVVIGPYEQLPATCNDHDPRSFEVARRVADLIESHLPDVKVEHVGSTAVPGCAGKGVVDLMVLYPPGRLPDVKDVLNALGFQQQTGRNPFPEERPLRLGSIEHDGTRFRLHVHVIPVDSPEVLELRTFRDRLRGEPLLLEQYVALKRKIIAQGVTDSLDYSIRKGEFIAWHPPRPTDPQGEHPGEARPLPRPLEPQDRRRVERAARQAGKIPGRVCLA